jgi:2'-5' RNA ligase
VLELTPIAHVHLIIAKFGNLPRGDGMRVAEALTRAASEWSTPRLQLRGFTTLESEDDPSVWVDLEGDIDALNAVARGVPEVAARLGLFLDRRVFQPRVRLGRVCPGASEPGLEALLTRLAAFETNKWWQTGFSVVTPAEHGPDELPYNTIAEIPLGPHVVH